MLQQVIHAVRAAGRAIEVIASDGFSVEQKGAQGPVTEADRAADALLHEALLDIDGCGWLSEETADTEARLTQQRLWVVDPLDGTKEFVGGIPEYSVAVALVDHGEAVLGVVHNPSTGETFWAERGGGAYKDGARITVADGDRILASRSEVRRGEFAPFMTDWDIQHIGSIEYKLARVAAGDAAVTLSRGPKWEWDVCAGSVIVQEAGGIATDVFGNELRFNQPFPKTKGVLAGARQTHARVQEIVESLGVTDRMREFRDVD